jgi:hypothetical protein
MATAAIPIQKIRVDSTLTTTVSRTSVLHPLIRITLLLWLVPRVLSYIVTQIADKLGKLTSEQAVDLYGPLFQLHLEVGVLLNGRPTWPALLRVLTVGWSDKVLAQSDKLGDIVESIAWGSDSELRDFINDSVSELEACER